MKAPTVSQAVNLVRKKIMTKKVKVDEVTGKRVREIHGVMITFSIDGFGSYVKKAQENEVGRAVSQALDIAIKGLRMPAAFNTTTAIPIPAGTQQRHGLIAVQVIRDPPTALIYFSSLDVDDFPAVAGAAGQKLYFVFGSGKVKVIAGVLYRFEPEGTLERGTM